MVVGTKSGFDNNVNFIECYRVSYRTIKLFCRFRLIHDYANINSFVGTLSNKVTSTAN